MLILSCLTKSPNLSHFRPISRPLGLNLWLILLVLVQTELLGASPVIRVEDARLTPPMSLPDGGSCLTLGAAGIGLSEGSSRELVLRNTGDSALAGIQVTSSQPDFNARILNAQEQGVQNLEAGASARLLIQFQPNSGSAGLRIATLTLSGSGLSHRLKVQAYCGVAGGIAYLTSSDSHSLVLKSDGSLWVFGNNSGGKLGLGDSNTRLSPTLLWPSGVAAVYAGSNHSLVLREDGSLWAMGANGSGQLGLGDNLNRNVPTRVLAAGVSSAAVGPNFSLLLKADGSLWGMGSNASLPAAGAPHLLPVQIVSSNVAAVAAGGSHSLLVGFDGSLWSVGANENGQLGLNDDQHRLIPTKVWDDGAAAVSAAANCSYVIKTDGSLWAFGDNSFGSLGLGADTPVSRPRQVIGADALTMSASSQFCLVLLSNGEVQGMGKIPVGLRLIGTYDTPVTLVPSGIAGISAGDSNYLLLQNQGALVGRGSNNRGQLGLGAENTWAGTITALPFQTSSANRIQLPEVTTASSMACRLTAYAFGGQPPYTLSITNRNSLPQDYTLVGTVLRGLHAQGGDYEFTASISDSAASPATAQCNFGLRVFGILNAAQLPGGNAHQAYSTTLSAVGNNVRWSAPNLDLPSGLQLDAQSGALTGTPALGGNYRFEILANNGQSAVRQEFRLTVFDVQVTGRSQLTVQDALGIQFSSNSGTPPFQWGCTNLPAGLTLNPATGRLSGSTSAAGNHALQILLSDSALPQPNSYPFIFNLRIFGISGEADLPKTTLSTDYSATLQSAGSSGNVTWSLLAGALPDGLNLNSNGQISGNPTVAGNFSFTLQAQDSSSPPLQTQRAFNLAVFGITSALATRIALDTQSETALQAQGGSGAITWTLISGELPKGISLASDGRLFGIYRDAGSFSFALEAQDSSTPPLRTRKIFHQTVYGIINVSPLPSATAKVFYQTQLIFQELSSNTRWSLISGSLPAGLQLDPITGIISGASTRAGRSTFILRVADGAETHERAFSLNVALNVITPATLPVAHLDRPYSIKLAALGNNGQLTWSIQEGAAPPHVALNSSSGLISGSPSMAGNYAFTVRVQDGDDFIVQNFTLQVNAAVLEEITASAGRIGNRALLGPAPMDGGVSTRNLRLRNLATQNLTGIRLEFSGEDAGDFAALLLEESGNPIDQIPAKSTAVVNLTFQPRFGRAGMRSAKLAITAPGYLQILELEAHTACRGGIAAVAAGAGHTLFLKSDGSLWSCGDNSYGQLGLGDLRNRPRPVMVLASDVASICCGNDHSLIIKTDGSLWASGLNQDGQLGLGDQLNRNALTRVLESNVIAAAAGIAHTLVLQSDGTLLTMGSNEHGQLGLGDFRDRVLPTLTPMDTVTSVAAGAQHSLALKSGGGLWAAGDNGFGQLGFNDTVSESRFSQSTELTQCRAIASGAYHLLSLKFDQTLWTTGNNSNGQLGVGSQLDLVTPRQALTPSLRAIVAGSSHSIGLGLDGEVWLMGSNAQGQLGLNEPSTLLLSPIQSPLISGVVALAAGQHHSLFILGTGIAMVAGLNDRSQLGLGSPGATARLQLLPLCFTEDRRLGPAVLGQTSRYNLNSLTIGGVAPCNFEVVDGSLPPGLSIHADSGQLQGSPTQSGNYSFVLRARDSAAETSVQEQSFSISVLGITTDPSLPTASLGRPYLTQLSAAGGDGSLSWSLVEGALPVSLSLSSDGTLSGTPTSGGVYTFTAETRDNASTPTIARQSFRLAVFSIETAAVLPNTQHNQAYQLQLEASQGQGPLHWAVSSGQLPAGLILEEDGLLHGVCTKPGDYHFTVEVRDSSQPVNSTRRSMDLSVFGITTAPSLPLSLVGEDSQIELSAAGGANPRWAVAANSSLPKGIHLSETGILSGAPENAGRHVFTLEAAPEEQPSLGSMQTFEWVVFGIGNAPTLPAATLFENYRLQLQSQPSDQGALWSVKSGVLPKGLNLDESGWIQGVPTQAGNHAFTLEARAAPAESAVLQRQFTLQVIRPSLEVFDGNPSRQILTSDSTIHFDACSPGRSLDRAITLRNTGSSPLLLSGLQWSGGQDDFQWIANPDAGSLEPGAELALTLRYSPAMGPSRMRRATLSILSNDPDRPEFKLHLVGQSLPRSAETQVIRLLVAGALYAGANEEVPVLAYSSSGLRVRLGLQGTAAELLGEESIGYRIRPLSAGVVTIIAEQNGNLRFAPAKRVLLRLNILAMPVKPTWIHLAHVYDGQPKSASLLPASPGTTFTYYKGKTALPSAPRDAGSYTVVAVVKGSRLSATLVIHPRPFFLVAEDQQRRVLLDNPPLGSRLIDLAGNPMAANEVSWAVRPQLTTKATALSPPGHYAIQWLKSGVSANHLPIPIAGILTIEGYGVAHQALITETDGTGQPRPVGLLNITCSGYKDLPRRLSFSANLLSRFNPGPSALTFAGHFSYDDQQQALQCPTLTNSKSPISLVNLSLDREGKLIGTLRLSANRILGFEGQRLLESSEAPVSFQGLHTLMLGPAQVAGDGSQPPLIAAPAGRGQGQATINRFGTILLSAVLGDGSKCTAALPCDTRNDPGYRLFCLPLARLGSQIGGSFQLRPSQRSNLRRQVGNAKLTWEKNAAVKDSSYPDGFGTTSPLVCTMNLDPWVIPAANLLNLPQLLGLPQKTLLLRYPQPARASTELAIQASLSLMGSRLLRASDGSFSNWTCNINPASGSLSASFQVQLNGRLQNLQLRANLRQPENPEDPVIGGGYLSIPALAPAASPLFGEVLLQR